MLSPPRIIQSIRYVILIEAFSSPGQVSGGGRGPEQRREGMHLDGLPVGQELQDPQPAVAPVAMPAAAFTLCVVTGIG